MPTKHMPGIRYPFTACGLRVRFTSNRDEGYVPLSSVTNFADGSFVTGVTCTRCRATDRYKAERLALIDALAKE